MLKTKAVAIALPNDPFSLALKSAQNFFEATLDLMYGTPERSRITFRVAILLLCISAVMGTGEGSALPVCTQAL